MIPVHYYLFLGMGLFTVGVIGVLTRRNVIIVLMSIELILNAVNINLVAFSPPPRGGPWAGLRDFCDYRGGGGGGRRAGDSDRPIPQPRDRERR